MTLVITPLTGIPLVKPGDDLAAMTYAAVRRQGITPADGDILVFAQKIISKAEGRIRKISEAIPSPEAVTLAEKTGKDPRFVQIVLDESRTVLRARPGTIIVEDKRGFVCANAGIDRSNLEQDDSNDLVLLLPEDPDASARRLKREFETRWGFGPGIMIIDSFGRAWRNGVVGHAIGLANVPALIDLRGEPDLFGYELRVTQVAAADQLAAAASLMIGEAGERTPVAHVSGFPYKLRVSSIAEVIRDEKQDLFR